MEKADTDAIFNAMAETAVPVWLVAMNMGYLEVKGGVSSPVYFPYNLPEHKSNVNPSGNCSPVYFILEVSVRQFIELSVVPSICLPRTVRRGLARVNSSVEFIGMIVPGVG